MRNKCLPAAVEYDDGDEEWVRLSTQRYKLLVPGQEGYATPTRTTTSTAKAGATAAIKQRKTVIESDDEDDDEDGGAAVAKRAPATAATAGRLAGGKGKQQRVEKEDLEDEGSEWGSGALVYGLTNKGCLQCMMSSKFAFDVRGRHV